jgi:hypothetical protein
MMVIGVGHGADDPRNITRVRGDGTAGLLAKSRRCGLRGHLQKVWKPI